MSRELPASQTRIIIDANVLISYLMGQGRTDSTIVRANSMALGPDFILILPVGLLEELRAAPYKPQLSALLSKEMIEELIQILPGMLVASITTDPDQQVDTVRDWKDRYLIEAAVYNDVDILVTGDKDLLVLRDLLERPRILTPADFVGEFGASS